MTGAGSGIEVDLDDLDAIRAELETAAEDLDALGPELPAAPDAGPVTAFISYVVSRMVTSSGELAAAATASAENVALAREYYERADAEASATLDDIAEDMQE